MIHDIITGIPRSGTTLLLRILASAHPGRMALGEPEEILQQQRGRTWRAGEFVEHLYAHFGGALQRAAREGSYLDRRLPDLRLPDNYHGANGACVALRRVPFSSGPGRAGPGSGVICKENGPFVPLVSAFCAHRGFRLLRVVRHPDGVLPSWRRHPIGVQEGRMPHMEATWAPALAARLDRAPERSERQAILYGWLLRKLAAPGHTRESGLLRYEDLLRGAKLPPPHEQISTAPFLRPETGARLAPEESAAFLKTLQRVDAPAADLLQALYARR